MKRGKQALVALNLLLVPIVGVLTNVLAANFPALPPLVLWLGSGTIILVFVVVAVIIAVSEGKQNDVATTSHPKHQRSQNTGGQFSSPKPSSSHMKSNVVSVTHHPSVSPSVSNSQNSAVDQPTVDHPMLICLAIDVSASMKKSIIDHTGNAIERLTSVTNALEHFVHLGVAWVKDPGTQRILPLYHLMAYGFGFKETVYGLGMRKTPGGPVRDLLAHPLLSSLPSALELSEHWKDYRDHLLTWREYTGNVFGSTPMCQALGIIRDRIKEECQRKEFTFPVLLLIISDGLADDGDPLPIIEELHSLGVITLSCYLADKDVLAIRKLYDAEDSQWADGAKCLFRYASALQRDNYITQAMYDYLDDHGWQPHEGVRLFAQINQAEALGNFLEVLLRGSSTERVA